MSRAQQAASPSGGGGDAKDGLPNGSYVLVLAFEEDMEPLRPFPGALVWDDKGDSFTFTGSDGVNRLVLEFRNRARGDNTHRKVNCIGLKAILVDHQRFGTCVFTAALYGTPPPDHRLSEPQLGPLRSCKMTSIRLKSSVDPEVQVVSGRWLLTRTEKGLELPAGVDPARPGPAQP